MDWEDWVQCLKKFLDQMGIMLLHLNFWENPKCSRTKNQCLVGWSDTAQKSKLNLNRPFNNYNVNQLVTGIIKEFLSFHSLRMNAEKGDRKYWVPPASPNLAIIVPYIVLA